MGKKVTVRWADTSSRHDYPAAAAYSSLLAPATVVEPVVRLLAHATTVDHDAKDILRAARLPLPAVDESEVKRDITKIRKGRRLAPVLLVRGDLSAGRSLQIADGYHRVCASYHTTDDMKVACHIIELPTVAG